jgi:RNA polymerase sigma factor (sigma-70 family)
MPMEEPELIAALQSGDEHAPRLLVERFQGIVFGLCFRMLHHRQDAEDLTQETFLRAMRSIRGFDPTRPLRPWVLGIAVNRCRTAISSRSRRNLISIPLTVEEPIDHRPGLTDPDDLAGELERAMSDLRPEYRMVFSLYHEQALSYEEIALSISRPVGTVKTWLHRARAQLAEQLSRRGVNCES